MRLACLGLLAGTWLLQQQASLLSVPWLLALSLLTLATLLAIWRLHRHGLPQREAIPESVWRRGLALLLAVGMAMAGFVIASAWAHWYLRHELPVELEQQSLQLEGVISSLPSTNPNGRRFFFDVEQVISPALSPLQQRRFPSSISLGWYGLPGQSLPDLQPGQRWRLTAKLLRPHGLANPGGFDYEVWLLQQGVRATGTVQAGMPAELLEQRVAGLSYRIQLARAVLRERIHQALPQQPFAGILVALVIGEQREIPQSDWQIFNRTGITHLISISGMHITLIAGMLAGLVNFVWRLGWGWQARQLLYLPAQQVAVLAAALFALMYVALAGFGVPAQRTLYMLAVVAVAVWRGRAASFSAVLCAALALVIVLDPWAVLWPGFWLSFAAVAVMLFAAQPSGRPSQGRWGSWKRAVVLAGRTQYAVTVGLVPLCMLWFGQVSLISPLANALAIPLISFAVTPLALLGSVLPGWPAQWVLQAAHALLGWLHQFLSYLSAFPLAVWQAPRPDWLAGLLALCGTAWLLAPRGWPLRWLGLLTYLPLIFPALPQLKSGELRVLLFDVGQGTAVLLETAGHKMLYDSGPVYSADSDAAERVILPYLAMRGIDSLDLLMISHQDQDHAGGAARLMQQIKPALISSSMDAAHPLLKGLEQRPCNAGQRWVWDQVRFEVLHPDPLDDADVKLKPNARSCVLKVSAGQFGLLLAGDIGRREELRLVQSAAQQLAADVLLAPHHGSAGSSSAAFLQAVQPELALISAGYKNRYRHPAPAVLQRYADFGINHLRTDQSGAIQLIFDASLRLSAYRHSEARYWRSHPQAANERNRQPNIEEQ